MEASGKDASGDVGLRQPLKECFFDQMNHGTAMGPTNLHPPKLKSQISPDKAK